MKTDGKVNHYPVDFDTLAKGQRITVEKLEVILDVSRDNREYDLRLLGLREQIKREMFQRGIIVSVRSEKGDLIICDDSDASAYTQSQFNRAQRKMVRSHFEAGAVDIRKLTADEKTRHEKALLVQGTLLSAITAAKRRLRLTAHKRQTPGLPDETKGEKESAE